MNDLISVIIPVYNVEKYLDKCVESVIKQTHKNLEIVLVDDGSLDNCPKMCDRWTKKDNRIKVIHKENGGLSDARNVGIDNTIGKYIYFLDSDDYIDKDMLENLYNDMKKNNSKISACGFIYETENKKEPYYCKENYVENSESVLKRIFQDNDISTCIWDKLYQRDLFDEIRFPKGKIHEDTATLYKLIDKAKVISHISKAQHHYVQREGSILNSKFDTKQLDIVFFKEEIVFFIKEKYQNILEEAENFYIQQLNKSIVLCYKNKLKKEYKTLKKKLKAYFPRIMKNSKMTTRTKIKSTIIILGGSHLLKK